MYRLFVVEDDRGIAESVKRYLDGFGYETVLAEDFGDVLGQFVREAPHLVILDISLPFFNGYYWCAEIRRLSKVPVLFLSSAGDNMNIIMAMDQGGDDFIPKPFDLNVLVSKVRALLRRAYEFQSQTALIEHRGAVLDLGSGVLVVEERGQTSILPLRQYSGCEKRTDCRYLLFGARGVCVPEAALTDAQWEELTEFLHSKI